MFSENGVQMQNSYAITCDNCHAQLHNKKDNPFTIINVTS